MRLASLPRVKDVPFYKLVIKIQSCTKHSQIFLYSIIQASPRQLPIF
jgi:hypothetical protein